MSSAAAPPTVDYASGDHYAVLGVSRSASEADIAKAYKLLALRHHPDKNQNKAASEVSFKRISEAYAVLRDPEKRSEYDRTGGVRSYVSYDEAERMWRLFSAGEDEQLGPGDVGADAARRESTALFCVLGVMFLAPRLLMQLLPGVTAAVLVLALLSRLRGGDSSKLTWCALALLLATYLAPWMLGARSSFEPLVGVQPPRGSKDSFASVGIPHSGEEILMSDGRFLRLADPARRGSKKPTAAEGWQQRLLGDMTGAIQKGREQVVTVFSRQGCPWCDRQLPVLQRFIEQRAVGQTAPGGLMSAPLRVFVFDAEEFPYLAQTFKIEAFPTTIAWGPPGVTPMAAQGYLDDENLSELLRTVAMGGPSEASK
eukprot:TRINITY_DN62567_c0_g1_i1.p1 TRINITY_DN62567_c0_g1~~TRINITY_DN62567_c0_g1_i1.p1  ORF type:complete len:370 (+),score=56.90 TRINITY_DN62567_c0_g1_i1:124-1233(+)